MSPDANWFDTGAASRDKMLQEEYEEKRDGPHDWLQIFKSLDVPAMGLLDVSNVYYSLPAPDACPYKLITAVEKNMSKENPLFQYFYWFNSLIHIIPPVVTGST
jgi:hypothetical protein